MKIVITGSLGNVSEPLVTELVQKGQEVSVISSKAEKQKAIEDLGAKAAIGFLDDIAFLTKTFTGADVVYCMVPPNFGEPDQLAYYKRLGNSYAKAIQQSGVPRAIHLSSYGAHLESGTGFIVGSYHIEKMLNALPNVAVTHMRPSFFYYNLLGFARAIKAMGFIAANYGGDDKLSMVAPSDIAAAIADEILAEKNSKIRYVMSDDRPCNEVATVLGNAIGKPDLQWKTVSNEQMQKALESNGVPLPIAINLTELGAATHSGVIREDLDKQKPTIGKIKIEEFAKEFADAYQKM